jgi:hypothetical protein
MTIPPASAANPYQAAAALDRALRSPDSDPGDSPSDPESGPDVIVTLGQSSQAAATYDASGKLPSSASADSGSDDDDSTTSDATGSASAANDSSADATADNEETAAA